MTDANELSADDIRDLLRELGARLSARAVSTTIYLVGGAAIALSLDTRRVTSAIDAIYDHSGAVDEIVADMADRHGLAEDWLNSAARPYANQSGDRDATVFETGGLSVATASPRHLLAMKLAAYRQQDLDDLALLFRTLGIDSPEAAVDIAWDVYGDYAETAGGGPREDFLLRAEAVLAGLEEKGPDASNEVGELSRSDSTGRGEAGGGPKCATR